VVNDQWSLALPLLGRHNAMNALAALAVAEALDVSIETVTEGLAEASPPAARMQLRRFSLPEGPCFVIDDSYNANPDSMRPALCVLLDELANSTDPAEESAGQTPAGGRAVAVLGEMRELGATSEREHRALGHWLAARSYQPAAVMTVGQQARPIGEALTASGGRSEVEAFDGLDSATIETIASRVKPHDVVLIKGSRGVGLERVIAAIEARAVGER
jgi:UDP-N-acetylmuramoyl-tripeptide--D-alanyl-D-alanine ligase